MFQVAAASAADNSKCKPALELPVTVTTHIAATCNSTDSTKPTVNSGSTMPAASTDVSNPTFYKRALPVSCIALHTQQGKALFRESLDQDYMESYFILSMQFLTQSEPAFCGLSSLCMVLNALEMDPLRTWKGVWRWYDESMLDCCRSLKEIRETGISIAEFVCLAQCNGLTAHLHRPGGDSTYDNFLKQLKQACQSPDIHMVVSYDRKALGQTGTGHFSPIGGYNETKNMVLILDVARFKYPPYWVSTDLLWESMKPLDLSTNKSRGYVILSRGTRPLIQSVFSQLSVTSGSWPQLANMLFQVLPQRLKEMPSNSTVEEVISQVISAIPDVFNCIVDDRTQLFLPKILADAALAVQSTPTHFDDNTVRATVETQLPLTSTSNTGSYDAETIKQYIQGLDELLAQICSTELYATVSSSIAAKRKLKTLEDILNGIAVNDEALQVLSQIQSQQSFFSSTCPKEVMSPDTLVSSADLNLSMLDHGDGVVQNASAMSLFSRPSFNGNIPLSIRYSVLDRMSRRNSVAALYPAYKTTDPTSSLCNNPSDMAGNDFCAFLTLFLFALFSFRPLYENLPMGPLEKQIRRLVDAGHAKVSEGVWAEIYLLKNQMAALTELQQDSNK
ncbi:hypothetical protein BDV3_001010 [Batrachochytrium dendrobatidis]